MPHTPICVSCITCSVDQWGNHCIPSTSIPIHSDPGRLGMILNMTSFLYYDACYAHRSSSSKGFHHKCSYQYRSGGTCCSHTEWTRLLGMCPFLSTLLFLILDPNHQEYFQWYMPWTGCDTTSSFHGKMKKSCPTCNQCICHFDGLHI